MNWNKEIEDDILLRRENGDTYRSIAEVLGTTTTSVKHKVRRLQQSNNNDKYKHTKEKKEIAERYLTGSGLQVLETHSGFGGMSEVYSLYGNVQCYDIVKDRVEAVNSIGSDNVQCIKGDSEKEILRLLNNKCIYDVVDIDPYGMPSRYFPYAFGLINNGLLFITLPMIGVAQMNKITIRHLQAFWGVDYKEKDTYIEKVLCRLKDYAFMQKREIEVLSVDKIDRIFRISLRVRKKSLCDIVGLSVNRNKIK